jgi:ferredoxin
MTQTRSQLLATGIAADHVHTEAFTKTDRASRATPEPGDHSAPSVQWLTSGVDDVQRPGETLLAASNRAGADVPFICESGECGTCLVKVLSGTVTTEPDTCLTEEEAANGFVLACSSYAHDAVVLDA